MNTAVHGSLLQSIQVAKPEIHHIIFPTDQKWSINVINLKIIILAHSLHKRKWD